VWISTDVTINQRVEAARALVPLGSKIEDVRRILGQPDRNLRLHGSLVSVDDAAKGKASPPAGDYEAWMMEYEFRDGLVLIQFKRPHPTSPWRELTCTRISAGAKAEALPQSPGDP
jgi:hypothetical protein